MRVTETIHLAASGTLGFSMTDALDCNVWLAETGDGLALFDSGAGRDIPAMLAQIAAGGADPAGIRHIFLTHAHADHSGGTAPLLEQLPAGVTVHAGRQAAERMQSNDETRISLDRARRVGVYPPDYRWRGVAVGNVMADGGTVRLGRLAVQLMELPGHSDDSCAFLLQAGEADTVLVGGDTVFADGRVIIQDIPDCSIPAIIDSIRRLAAVPFATFLPGHGVFSVRDGMRHVARAREYCERGLAPPSYF